VTPPAAAPADRIRPLPRTVRPVHHETLDSYLGRLAAANGIPSEDLLAYLGATRTRRDRGLLERLAVASRQPQPALLYALVELHHLGTGQEARDWRFSYPRRWNRHGHALPACRQCMAARGITSQVVVFIPFYQRVCPRHRRWLGQYQQVDVTGAAEIVQAHRQQRRIARRHGADRTSAADHGAAYVIDRWLRRSDPEGIHQRWMQRLDRLEVTSNILAFGDARLQAVVYPERTVLTGVLASRYWTDVFARNRVAARDALYVEVARRLDVDVGSVRIFGAREPIEQWLEDRIK
jgi:hypothetical protein